ncbi:MAG: PDZ domain-containing protein [Candidatus Hydrogenedentota bacterium]
MAHFGSCLVLFAILSGSVPARSEDAAAPRKTAAWEALKEDIAIARDRVFPSLINIRVVIEEYEEGGIRKEQVIGSGVIVGLEETSALALTNYHVAGRAVKLICTLHNQEEVPAELLGEDPLTDLALLRLDLSSVSPEARPPAAVLGNSDDLDVGDYVMAMGSPWALARSVTLGIVSNKARVFASDEGDDYELENGEQTGLLTRWIQHDASISPGNSGGPLVNLKGEVIGINELANMIGGDMGFAIPSNLARDVMRKLADSGEVERSWIGIDVRPINRTEFTRGVLVSSVVESSPADIAGIRAGDLIVGIDGAEFTARFPEHMPLFHARISDNPPGSSIRLQVERDSRVEERTVVTEKLNDWLGREGMIKRWGITICEITEPLAREERIDDPQGVMVTDLRQGGPAVKANPPLIPEDIIRRVNGHGVSSVEELLDLAADTAIEKEGKILLDVERNRARLIVLLKPEDPEEVVDRAREFRKAWLGVEVQAMTPELSRRIAPGQASGVRIARVYEGTTAEAAGLAVGDIITALNGEPLRIRYEHEAGNFQSILSGMRIGGTTKIALLRNGEKQELEATLEAAPLRVEDARRFKDNTFDIGVREITFYDRMRMRWSGRIAGVLVESSEPGGWAGLAGLSSGDLIEKINGETTPTIAAFRAVLDRVKDARLKRFVVVARRKNSTDLLYVEPEWEENE